MPVSRQSWSLAGRDHLWWLNTSQPSIPLPLKRASQGQGPCLTSLLHPSLASWGQHEGDVWCTLSEEMPQRSQSHPNLWDIWHQVSMGVAHWFGLDPLRPLLSLGPGAPGLWEACINPQWKACSPGTIFVSPRMEEEDRRAPWMPHTWLSCRKRYIPEGSIF